MGAFLIDAPQIGAPHSGLCLALEHAHYQGMFRSEMPRMEAVQIGTFYPRKALGES